MDLSEVRRRMADGRLYACNSPELFAEGTAHAVSAQVVLHWYRPKESNPLAKKEQLICALVQAGATYPTITSNVEEIILEFEMEEAAAGGSI